MLVWKLLRSHVSLSQLSGFSVSNLLGMLIVLLGVQFYRDVAPVFDGQDAFMPANYLVISKKITGTGGLFGNNSSCFTPSETEDLSKQPFVVSAGEFTASQYEVRASVGMAGIAGFSTDMFFEAVPDEFVDIDLNKWHFDAESEKPEVPIVLPRNYLTIYNFGFAQSRSLPKMSESVISNITINLRLRGSATEGQLKGRVVGFGQRLNTILVPQEFIDWSNAMYSPTAKNNPTRLIIKVSNTADDRIATYMQAHGYEVEDDKAEAGRVTFLLRVVSGIVLGIGLLISLLSIFVLMLSIYLLVQKNTTKLQNLLLIGYPVWRVALPYQILTVAVNALVLVAALILMNLVRGYYTTRLLCMFPDMNLSSPWPAYCVAGILFVVVSMLNIIVVKRKINKLF